MGCSWEQTWTGRNGSEQNLNNRGFAFFTGGGVNRRFVDDAETLVLPPIGGSESSVQSMGFVWT
jgi:hypothetical protein